MKPDKLVRIGAASLVTGIPIRQVRYFDKLGIVTARSIGSHRGYGTQELRLLRTLKALMDKDPQFTPKRTAWLLGICETPELRRLLRTFNAKR